MESSDMDAYENMTQFSVRVLKLWGSLLSNTVCILKAYDSADDWSEHISSSGKKYYYNCRTEVSQWEKPKEWLERYIYVCVCVYVCLFSTYKEKY